MIQRNVIAMSGRAVEASGDVDVLLLDKTGTITLGNRAADTIFSGTRHRRGPTSPMPRSFPRWPTKRPRDAPLLCWQRSATNSVAASSPRTARLLFHFPPRHGCPVWTSTAAKSAKAPWRRSAASAMAAATAFLKFCRCVYGKFRMRVGLLCWWRRMAACWVPSRSPISSKEE